jgi:hypothetical protein
VALVNECGGSEACAKHLAFLTNGEPLKVVGAEEKCSTS